MFNSAVFLVLLDSQSFARLQDAYRESKRQVDKQRERMASLEASRKQLESDMAELQRLDRNRFMNAMQQGLSDGLIIEKREDGIRRVLCHINLKKNTYKWP